MTYNGAALVIALVVALLVGIAVILQQAHIQRLEWIMTQFADDQSHLNADVALIASAVTGIQAEIEMLKNQTGSGALDFSGLDAAVSGLQGLANPVQPNPDEAAVPTDTTPVETDPTTGEPVVTDPNA